MLSKSCWTRQVPDDLTQETIELLVSIGDVSAHMSLAQCYNHGKGVEQNFEKMFSHHLKAAESGMWISNYPSTHLLMYHSFIQRYCRCYI